MTTTTITPPQAAGPSPAARLARPARDVVAMTRRNLAHIRREPLQLSDVTIQPVLFTLLFIYVLGSGVPIAGGSYKAFALAGLMLLNITTSAIGTGVGLCSDLATGVIDRFRTLPMWRAAVLVGRSVSDLLSSALCVAFVALTGLVIGWRPQAGVGSVLAGFGVVLLFGYGIAWGCACLGLLSKGPESAQGLGLVILFPLAIVSNAMVPTQHMPSVLRVITDWNPVSAVTSAARHLFGNPNPAAGLHAWPVTHPVAAALLWSGAMIAAFAPLAAWAFRRRTND